MDSRTQVAYNGHLDLEAALDRAVHQSGNGHHHAHGAHDHHAFLHQPVSIIDRVGDTPLLEVRNLTSDWGIAPTVRVYAKAEWFNPGGSVKDRPALRIIEQAERKGLLNRDKVLIDSTSGNTGIAYAWIAATKGYRVALVMPENVSEERKQTLRAFGAELIFSDPLEGSDGAINRVREIVASDPARYYYADQYNNDANWQAHFLTTGPEIWAQTNGSLTHFVSGVGTSGTLIGTGRFLRKVAPRVRVVGVQPEDELSVIEGLKHIPTAIRPGIYDESLLDETVFIDPGHAYDMARAMGTREGWLVGFSAGAAMHVALERAQQLDAGVVVAILPDSGTKYLSLMR
jgi:S-sulfo-L-cysteine synthase (O-acetyl-L-serine-dependent)